MCILKWNKDVSFKTYAIQLLSREYWAHQLCIWVHTWRCIRAVCLHFHEQLIGHFLCNATRWIQLIAKHMCDMHILARCEHFHVLCSIIRCRMVSLRCRVCFDNFGIRWTGRWILNICSWRNRCDIINIRLSLIRDLQVREWIGIIIRCAEFKWIIRIRGKEKSWKWWEILNRYLVIRLKLTSSASCAVFALILTPRVSIFDGLLAVFRSGNSDEFGWAGCVIPLPFPMMFGGIFPTICDGDGFRTIAPPGTRACLSVKNIGSLTCKSAGCCTIMGGRCWDRFGCGFWCFKRTQNRILKLQILN